MDFFPKRGEGVKDIKIIQKKNSLATLFAVLIMLLSLLLTKRNIRYPTSDIGERVIRTKQGLHVVLLPYLERSEGMIQYRSQEKNFLLQHNSLPSLLQWKSRDQEIMISYTDKESIRLFIMFYEGVVLKRVPNFLAFVSDRETYTLLMERNVPVFYLQQSSYRKNAYQSPENELHQKKALMIKLVLEYGYNVLYCDIDVILFMNPFKNINGKENFHFWAENVNDVYGTGFMYAYANDYTLQLFSLIYGALKEHPEKKDYDLLNIIINNKTITELKSKKLSKLFQQGSQFYKSRQFFGDIYPNSLVMVHNNHVQDIANKVYLFNEMRVIDYEENDYYSNADNKYVTLRSINRVDAALDMSYLIMISKALQRIIILPSFPCSEGITAKECNLCGYQPEDCWKNFQELFHNSWREHTFLRSQLVSQEIQIEVLHDDIITFDERKSALPGYVYKKVGPVIQETDIDKIFKDFIEQRVIVIDAITFSISKWGLFTYLACSPKR